MYLLSACCYGFIPLYLSRVTSSSSVHPYERVPKDFMLDDVPDVRSSHNFRMPLPSKDPASDPASPGTGGFIYDFSTKLCKSAERKEVCQPASFGKFECNRDVGEFVSLHVLLFWSCI